MRTVSLIGASGRYRSAVHEIGRARPDEIPALPEIERRACVLFRTVPATADLPDYLTPVEDFEAAAQAGLLWVARGEDGRPVGFALAEDLGDSLHLEELDVLPEHGRSGIGAALVARVLEAARTRGTPLTLCTFREVPWNAPWYTRLGFRPMAPGELSRSLRARIDEETARGLPAALRVAMILGGPRPPGPL
jgi:GNAT superfamily N-acetyltransferase